MSSFSASPSYQPPSYSSHRIAHLPAVSDILRAALKTSERSPAYSSRLTRHRTPRMVLAIVLSRLTPYRTRRQRPDRHRTPRMVLAIVLSRLTPYRTRRQRPDRHPPYRHLPVTSYSPSYSPHLTRCRTCRLGRARHPPHRHHTRSILLVTTLVSSYGTTSRCF
jgi:hypothetical protein